MLIRVILVFLVFASEATFAWQAQAGEKVESIVLDHKRPANFYSLGAAANAPVCESVLRSLNREFILDTAHGSRPDWLGELLLSSELQVRWKDIDSRLENQENSRTEFSVVDVGRGGTPRKFARRSSSRFNEQLGFKPGGHQIFVMERDERPRPQNEVRVNLGRALDVAQMPNIAAGVPSDAVSRPVFFNVIVVNQTPFVLAIDALEAQISLPKAFDGGINLYVLQFNNARDVRPICRLTGSG